MEPPAPGPESRRRRLGGRCEVVSACWPAQACASGGALAWACSPRQHTWDCLDPATQLTASRSRQCRCRQCAPRVFPGAVNPPGPGERAPAGRGLAQEAEGAGRENDGRREAADDSRPGSARSPPRCRRGLGESRRMPAPGPVPAHNPDRDAWRLRPWGVPGQECQVTPGSSPPTRLRVDPCRSRHQRYYPYPSHPGVDGVARRGLSRFRSWRAACSARRRSR
mmetsp:Transcript_22509/g.66331  ORF Transcript_22509/g.66331 Transcript_22509/m.66331 type:complete len:223 (-) Transcript_22509:1363-2031(-)